MSDTTLSGESDAPRLHPAPVLAAWSLCRRELVGFFRQRSRVVSALVTPLVFWLMIGSGMGSSFRPTDSEGTPIANRVQPNKRPRSSMSPTIVFDANGDVELVTGSPGGSRIIGYTAQTVVNHIDYGLDPQLSVATPHYQNRNGSTDIELPIPGVTLDYDSAALEAALEARGHSVNVRSLTSGLGVIHVTPDELLGGADLRRDGTVGGR